MIKLQRYLEKHVKVQPLSKESPSKDLKAILVIPSFNEPDLLDTIHSLFLCNLWDGLVEILPILNHSDYAPQQIIDFHKMQYDAIRKIASEKNTSKIQIVPIAPVQLPVKNGGVGLARKIGMDEAVRRFEFLSTDGIIINLDADCLCHKDYLKNVLGYMDQHMEMDAVSIGFAHRWDHLNAEQGDAIILYELHLRSYMGWQKYFQYPFAFQTLGSCFAVRSRAYQAQGGMNQRKAGEDFYFLHKYSILNTLGEFNKAMVFPSGRISDRVPFGTGKAVNDIVNSGKELTSYNPKAIASFCEFMSNIGNFYPQLLNGADYKSLIPTDALAQFLDLNQFENSLHQVLDNCAHAISFQKRISKWFDPFRLMKYLHYARNTEFPDTDVLESAVELLIRRNKENINGVVSPEQLLNCLRKYDYPEL